MRSSILQTATRYLLPILLLFSVFLLLRGHYYPGGGFVGGLVASIAFVLHSFANGTNATMTLLGRKPLSLIPMGLGIAALSVLAPVLWGYPHDRPLGGRKFPIIGSLGSALFFDLGVYLVVVGVVLTILFTISLTDD
ncbi:Na(+)/H(+) antiporter subunit B [Niabella sp. W65]|nr:Na(+)/H(+) antiporter subunit B [Niabella sp. W65]MCH7367403.1 Na(+)/H(+) antiporter subunit B [Niabella sp. W65]ULT43643.1 Na(+)/H(+) antiporter subunit B [Niabella sp. I65]